MKLSAQFWPALFLVIFLCQAPLNPATGEELLQWQNRIIDMYGETGWRPSIALDADNNAHIKYGAYDDRSASGGWGNLAPGGSFEIAVDGEQLEHFVYPASWTMLSAGPVVTYKHCKYYWNCYPEAVAYGLAPVLTVDSNNIAWIAYFDEIREAVVSARQKNTTDGMADWHMVGRYLSSNWLNLEPLPTASSESIQLALDAENRPHLTYCKKAGANESTVYAHWADGAWAAETIAPRCEKVALALDNSGVPLVALITSDGSVSVTRRSADGWQKEPVEKACHAGGKPSLKLDAENRPWLVYACDNDGSIQLATRTAAKAGEWSFETFPDAQFPALAVKGTNRPQIAYQTVKYKDAALLEFAASGATIPQPPADFTQPLRNYLETLSGTPEGPPLIDLYNRLAIEADAISAADPGISWDAYRTLQDFLPVLETYRAPAVSGNMVQNLKQLTARLVRIARPDHRAALQRQIERLKNFDVFEGMTRTEIFHLLGGNNCTLTCKPTFRPPDFPDLPVSVKWEFSDGMTFSTPLIGRSFEEPGTYSWKFTASAIGFSCTFSDSYTVEAPTDASPVPSPTGEVMRLNAAKSSVILRGKSRLNLIKADWRNTRTRKTGSCKLSHAGRRYACGPIKLKGVPGAATENKIKITGKSKSQRFSNIVMVSRAPLQS